MSVYKISGSGVISENPEADQLDTAIDALTEFEEIEVEVQVDFPTIS